MKLLKSYSIKCLKDPSILDSHTWVECGQQARVNLIYILSQRILLPDDVGSPLFRAAPAYKEETGRIDLPVLCLIHKSGFSWLFSKFWGIETYSADSATL